jgi:hypothetical protein
MAPKTFFRGTNMRTLPLARYRKVANKKMQQSAVVSMYSPRRVKCPAEPPEVQNTVRVTKSVQLQILTSASAPLVVSPATIMGAVPGGNTYWAKMRLQGARLWSETAGLATAGVGLTPILRVDIQNEGTDSPTISWSDTGTTGHRRPGIAFQPGLREQAQWFGAAATTPLFNVRVTTGTTQVAEYVILQCVVEILSPNLS